MFDGKTLQLPVLSLDGDNRERLPNACQGEGQAEEMQGVRPQVHDKETHISRLKRGTMNTDPQGFCLPWSWRQERLSQIDVERLRYYRQLIAMSRERLEALRARPAVDSLEILSEKAILEGVSLPKTPYVRIF